MNKGDLSPLRSLGNVLSIPQNCLPEDQRLEHVFSGFWPNWLKVVPLNHYFPHTLLYLPVNLAGSQAFGEDLR